MEWKAFVVSWLWACWLLQSNFGEKRQVCVCSYFKGCYLIKAGSSGLNKEGETPLAPLCILGVWGSCPLEVSGLMVILGGEGSRADSPCVMGGPGSAASLPSIFGKAQSLHSAHGTCLPQTLGTEPPVWGTSAGQRDPRTSEKREPHLLRCCCPKFDLGKAS